MRHNGRCKRDGLPPFGVRANKVRMEKMRDIDSWGMQNLPGRPRTAVRRFAEDSDALINEWIAKQASPPARRAESPNAWLKREAYRLILPYVNSTDYSIFLTVCRFDRRSDHVIGEATKNPFKLGLLAISCDDSVFSRQNRNVFGNQMLYAWRHDVPPEFLNAFLAISGGPSLIAKKISENYIEPGFESRYVHKREN